MEFNPSNHIVQRCIQGLGEEDNGNPTKAGEVFLLAWNEATNDFEKYLASYFVARHQSTIHDKLKWLETCLRYAKEINDVTVKSAYPSLYSSIGKCYSDLNDDDKAKEHYKLADFYRGNPDDKGPFFHGTRADLQIGDLLKPGGYSNYKADLTMNHIYFTANVHGAGLAAALAKGEGVERVYIVEPTGIYENDPNVTDKKFPGNPTRSYRSLEPLKIIGEINDWSKITPEELQKWRQKLNENEGEIIN